MAKSPVQKNGKKVKKVVKEELIQRLSPSEKNEKERS